MTNSYGLKTGKGRKYGWMFLLLAPGCGGGSTGSSMAAVLSGKSPSDSSGSGATVSASLIGSDGKLTALTDTAVKVDANGTYTLPATVMAGENNQLLIATKSASAATLGSVVVEGGFAALVAYNVTPIDANSSAAANLFVNAKSSGQWNADFTLGEMRALVSDDTAAKLGANQTDVSARASAALTALAPIAAWRSSLSASGFTAAQQTATLAKIAAAQATLDTQLNASTSLGMTNLAATAYVTAFVKAHGDAGATVEQLAASANASADVTAVYAGSLEAGLKGNVLARVEALRATEVSAAVAAELIALGASPASQATVVTAAATLQAQIAAAALLGAGTQVALKSAWVAYGATAQTELGAALMILPTVQQSVDAALAADLTAFLTARAGISASGTVAVAVDAESKALGQLKSSVMSHAMLLTAAAVTSAHATAYLSAVLDLNAAVGAR